MNRQILQKVELYRREEKRLRLCFDQFCNLLQLKHVPTEGYDVTTFEFPSQKKEGKGG